MALTKKNVGYLLGLTFLSVLLLSVVWEFLVEDLVMDVLLGEHESEPLFERLEYVATAVFFVALALVIPGWLALRGIVEREQAESSLEQAHTELERRVCELNSEVEKRQRTEEALRKSWTELRVLSSQLLISHENERRKIAIDLHDRITQSLSALKFRVEHIVGQMNHNGSNASVDLNSIIIPLIQDTIEEVRSIYMGLRPSMLDDLGLIATVNWFCRDFQDRCPHIQMRQELTVQENDIPDQLKIVIFRVLEQGLNNIAKYSEADRVNVILNRNNDTVELLIQDNGSGFQLEEISVSNPERNLDLSSMKERVELARGEFGIDAGKGLGIQIRASWGVAEVDPDYLNAAIS